MIDLVTGGCGFIGRHLVQLLHKQGRNVRVLDLDPVKNLPSSVQVLHGSVTDARAVRQALAGVQNLYHLAGNPNLWAPCKTDFETANFMGTHTILQEAARCNLNRIIFTSTESILAACKESQTRGFVNESVKSCIDDMPGPYCRSKFMAEQEAMSAAQNGLPIVIVNPTLPIGPGDRRLTPPSRMLLGFLNGKYPAYLDCTLNLIDVRDVALGHILAAEHGRIGERYILGNRDIRLSAVLAFLEEITGASMPRLKVPYLIALAVSLVDEFLANTITRHMPSAPLTGVRLAKRPVVFDCSKAVCELKLPLRPIEESLIDAISWLLEQGFVQRRLPKFSVPALTTFDQVYSQKEVIK